MTTISIVITDMFNHGVNYKEWNNNNNNNNSNSIMDEGLRRVLNYTSASILL